jgi:HSP20 family molecular chaperone IbpA
MAEHDAISWMWPEACAMIARAERLHRQFFHVGEARREPVWEPPIDILEAYRHIVVIVGLPGVPPESIGVTVDDGDLLITGERALPEELAAAWVHRMELPQGRFKRHVPLPRGRYHDVRSTSANGCLYITLTKLI